MFKVRMTIIDFIGDTEKYPCHHGYKLGDEFTFDGESFSGHICPSLALEAVPRMMEVHSAGPRYKHYVDYYPFLYAPLSVAAPELKKYDGVGYRNVLKNYKEAPHTVPKLTGSDSFKWPPPEKRFTTREVRVICPDFRTSVVAKIEAYDISDKARYIPFFRREMAILDKVLKKPGIKAEDVLGEFTRRQIEEIYPALSQVLIESLLEQLELMGYLKIKDGKVIAAKKAEAKLKEFKAGLSAGERKALQL